MYIQFKCKFERIKFLISNLHQVMKEGNMMNLKNMDVHVKWGGVHLGNDGDYETKYFEEGVQYTAMGKF